MMPEIQKEITEEDHIFENLDEQAEFCVVKTWETFKGCENNHNIIELYFKALILQKNLIILSSEIRQ